MILSLWFSTIWRQLIQLAKRVGAGGAYPENRAWCIAQMALLDFAQGGDLPAEQLLAQGLKAK